MHKIMFVFDNYDLLQEIRNPALWNDEQEIANSEVFRDGLSAYKNLKEKHYDIVITEIRITGMDGIQLLRSIKKENLCQYVVLCSEFQDFDYARQGIILGAFDYFVKPFSKDVIDFMLNRIKTETTSEDSNSSYNVNEILNFFQTHDKKIYPYISDVFDKIYKSEESVLSADIRARSVCEEILNRIFREYSWLELYITKQGLYSLAGISEANHTSYAQNYKNNIYKIFEEVCELLPVIHNDKIKEIILYILNNPDGDIKQKAIANKFYKSSSYLSTYFVAHTEIRFVDYLTTVRLKRARFLLRETNMKVSDIADRLDYRDMGYFSRIFKKYFGINPSECRMDNSYSYQI